MVELVHDHAIDPSRRLGVQGVHVLDPDQGRVTEERPEVVGQLALQAQGGHHDQGFDPQPPDDLRHDPTLAKPRGGHDDAPPIGLGRLSRLNLLGPGGGRGGGRQKLNGGGFRTYTTVLDIDRQFLLADKLVGEVKQAGGEVTFFVNEGLDPIPAPLEGRLAASRRLVRLSRCLEHLALAGEHRAGASGRISEKNKP
jgi:hypothetical protein